MSAFGDAVTTAIYRAGQGGSFAATDTIKAICEFPFSNRALADVLGERLDQIYHHGYTAEHDRAHPPTDLPFAALTYLEDAVTKLAGGTGHALPVLGDAPEAPAPWPWRDLFRPADARTNLVKACALLLGAIDRLDAGDGAAAEALQLAAHGAR